MAVTAQFLAGTDPTADALNVSSIPVVSATTDITSPFTGQVIYNTTDGFVYAYSGSAWGNIASGTGVRIPLAGQLRTTSTTGIGASEVACGTTNSVALFANTTYLVTFFASMGSGTSGAAVTLRLRSTSISGTNLTGVDVPVAASGFCCGQVSYLYQTSSAEAGHVFVGTVRVSSGTITLGATSYIIVEQFCANSLITTA